MAARQRLVVVGYAFLLLATMTGCIFPSDPTSGIGVTLDDGEILVLFNLCSGQTVQELQVGTSGDFLPEDVEVLWQITSTGNSSPVEIQVGTVPEGYEEVVALNVDLLAMELFGIAADLGDIQVATSVTVSELSEDRVVLEGHFFSRDEFMALDCNF